MISQDLNSQLSTNPQYNAAVIYNNYSLLDRSQSAYDMDINYKLFNIIKFNEPLLYNTVNIIAEYAIADSCFGFYLITSKLFWYNYNLFSMFTEQIVNSLISNIYAKNPVLIEFISEGANSYGIRVQEILSRFTISNNTSTINIDTTFAIIKAINASNLISDNTEHTVISDINDTICESIQPEEPVNEPFYEGSILDFASSVLSCYYDDVYTYSNNINNVNELMYYILIKVACPVLYHKNIMFDYGTDRWIYEWIANKNPFGLDNTNYGLYLEGIPEYDNMSPTFKMLTTFIEHLCMLITTHIIHSQPYAFDFEPNNPQTFTTKITNYINLMKKSIGVRY